MMTSLTTIVVVYIEDPGHNTDEGIVDFMLSAAVCRHKETFLAIVSYVCSDLLPLNYCRARLVSHCVCY